MSTLQHTDPTPRFRSGYLALLLVGIALLIAAVTIVVISAGGGKSTQANAAPAAAAAVQPSPGLGQLVQAHLRREEQAPGGGY